MGLGVPEALIISSLAGAGAAIATKPKTPKAPNTGSPAPGVAPKPKRSTAGRQSTLLTGPSGLASGSENVGGNTLLGQ